MRTLFFPLLLLASCISAIGGTIVGPARGGGGIAVTPGSGITMTTNGAGTIVTISADPASQLWGTNTTTGAITNRNGLYSQIQVGSSGTSSAGAITIDVISNAPGLVIRTNGVEVFKVNRLGDLSTIKSVSYLWPTAHGPAGSVLTDTNGTGTLDWIAGFANAAGTNITLVTNGNLVTISVTGLTNIVNILATNALNQNARIGPGTNNVLAKFTIGGTNVQNSPLQSSLTNSVEQRPRADGGDFNVASTNKIIGRETAGGDTNWLEFVAGAVASQSHHIRSQATGSAEQRMPITISDAVSFYAGTNQGGGNPRGGIIPLLGTTGAGIQTLGTFEQPFQDVVATRIFGTVGLTSGPQFGTGVGGTGFGINTENTGLRFFRDTGITASFDKDTISGQLMLDIAGNGLGFGVGLSNIQSGFLVSGIAGLVQASITNSSTLTPGTHGIMGVQGSGTDKSGGDLRYVGGPSTGTGTNGNVRLQTAEKALATSSALNSSFKDRLFIIADPIILATNVATRVFSASIPTALRGVGGQIIAHTEIENGVDIATRDDTLVFTANRKGSTVVTGIQATPDTATSSSGGSAAVTTTWTAVANSTSVDIKVQAVTSGILSTNSTCRVTFIPNSSAVPVIIYP